MLISTCIDRHITNVLIYCHHISWVEPLHSPLPCHERCDRGDGDDVVKAGDTLHGRDDTVAAKYAKGLRSLKRAELATLASLFETPRALLKRFNGLDWKNVQSIKNLLIIWWCRQHQLKHQSNNQSTRDGFASFQQEMCAEMWHLCKITLFTRMTWKLV